MAPLHCGNVAGVLEKAVWFALGVAAAYVALSGLRLWTQRRAAERAWRPLAYAVTGFGYGLPLSLLVASVVFFVARSADIDVNTAMMRSFLATLTLSVFGRSEEHTSELQSLMRISYAVFCLKKQRINKNYTNKL